MGHQGDMVGNSTRAYPGVGWLAGLQAEPNIHSQVSPESPVPKGTPLSREVAAVPEVSLGKPAAWLRTPKPALCLPVEEAGLLPEQHHHVAARVQVGAGDGHLGASGPGPLAGLQV